MLRYEPEPGAGIARTIDQVRLTFLDPVLPGVTIEVTDDAGVPVDGLGPTERSEDGRVATVGFPPLSEPGGYVVTYRFSAEDGDEQEESYRFAVGSARDDASGDGGLRDAAAPAAVAVAATAAALYVVWRRRRVKR